MRSTAGSFRRSSSTWASTRARRWSAPPSSARARASGGPSPRRGRRPTSRRGLRGRRRAGRSSSARRRPSASAPTSSWRVSARRRSRTSPSRSACTASSPLASTRRSSSSRAGVRVGICAWADPALIASGGFYPKKSMSAEARLRFYASAFDCVEVNSSYYAIPDARNVLRWVERTPPGFVFHVKAWSLMTGHHPKAESVPAELQALLPRTPKRTRRGEIDAGGFPPEAIDAAFRLFDAAIAPIAAANKLGYVLFQFAPWVHFDQARLAYLAGLPERLPGATIAVEFRHRSWFPDHGAETLRALRETGLAHVIVDGPAVAGAVERLCPDLRWPDRKALWEHAADAISVVLACRSSETVRAVLRACHEPTEERVVEV